MVALIGLSACSFMGVQSKPTPPWIGDGPVECNDYGLPLADGVVAAPGLGVGAVFVAEAFKGGYSNAPGALWLLFGLPPLVIGLVEAASASRAPRDIAGRGTRHSCRTAPRCRIPLLLHAVIDGSAWLVQRHHRRLPAGAGHSRRVQPPDDRV